MKKTNGLLASSFVTSNREITKEKWMNESFPQWGSYLNCQIKQYKVPKGQVSIWWCGGSSWVLKTDEGGIFWIDMFTGGSGYTERATCGVCRQSGAEKINWLTLTPTVIDPWDFDGLDGSFMTHIHQDHCDIYSIKAANQTNEAKFYGPKSVMKRLDEYEIPKEKCVLTQVGDVVEIPGGRVRILPCFDDTAIRTGGNSELLDYDDACVCFLFETSAGNILFMGDTWYNDGYAYFPEFFDIDVAIFDMGYNHPGATDKMTPYDCVRMGMALKCKTMIPDHYDNLAHTAFEPELMVRQFERIANELAPEIKTTIMQHGGMYQYPRDLNMKRYRFKDGSENVDIKSIPAYKKLAEKFEPKKK